MRRLLSLCLAVVFVRGDGFNRKDDPSSGSDSVRLDFLRRSGLPSRPGPVDFGGDTGFAPSCRVFGGNDFLQGSGFSSRRRMAVGRRRLGSLGSRRGLLGRPLAIHDGGNTIIDGPLARGGSAFYDGRSITPKVLDISGDGDNFLGSHTARNFDLFNVNNLFIQSGDHEDYDYHNDEKYIENDQHDDYHHGRHGRRFPSGSGSLRFGSIGGLGSHRSLAKLQPLEFGGDSGFIPSRSVLGGSDILRGSGSSSRLGVSAGSRQLGSQGSRRGLLGRPLAIHDGGNTIIDGPLAHGGSAFYDGRSITPKVLAISGDGDNFLGSHTADNLGLFNVDNLFVRIRDADDLGNDHYNEKYEDNDHHENHHHGRHGRRYNPRPAALVSQLHPALVSQLHNSHPYTSTKSLLVGRRPSQIIRPYDSHSSPAHFLDGRVLVVDRPRYSFYDTVYKY